MIQTDSKSNHSSSDSTRSSVSVMENHMETSADQVEEVTLLKKNSRTRKGGYITIPFIIANEAFEKVASIGLLPNMIMYLMKEYRMKLTKGQNILFIWSAATNFMPVVGAFVCDSYLGRFLGIALGSSFSFLGMALLWLTSMIPKEKPTAGDLGLLLASFAIMSIGAGGIRPCSLAFGADQLDKKENPNNKRVLESYFGWYYAAASIGVMIGFTGIVYIQDNVGWKVGFGVPALCMFFSTFVFLLASPLYVKREEKSNLIAGFAQVVVAAYRNRKLPISAAQDSTYIYHRKKDSDYVKPSDKLKCLNKACIIRNLEQDIAPNGSTLNPWRLCTIEQVEELKALIMVLPIWSTGIIFNLTTNTGSFGLLQANSMNRHLTSGFEVPSGSFTLFMILTIAVWVILYDRVLIPVASKIRGKPVNLGTKLRMGIGLFFACLHMVVAAIVETVRKNRAIKEGYLNNPHAVVRMSAFWLVPQLCIGGLAEAFSVIGQNEFYYTEFPKTMSSIAASLSGLNMAIANLLASVVLNSVDSITSRGGKDSWVSDNINRGHFNYYYWLLAALCLGNILYFVLCSWLYGPCANLDAKIKDEDASTKLENELVSLDTKEH